MVLVGVGFGSDVGGARKVFPARVTQPVLGDMGFVSGCGCGCGGGFGVAVLSAGRAGTPIVYGVCVEHDPGQRELVVEVT